MFLIETYLAISDIDGVGLYTKHTLKPGTVVARWDSNVDRVFEYQVFNKLPEVVKRYIHKHGTKDKNGNWKLGMDGDQYINHSVTPNLIRHGDKLIAETTIWADVELTCDYRPFRNDIQ